METTLGLVLSQSTARCNLFLNHCTLTIKTVGTTIGLVRASAKAKRSRALSPLIATFCSWNSFSPCSVNLSSITDASPFGFHLIFFIYNTNNKYFTFLILTKCILLVKKIDHLHSFLCVWSTPRNNFFYFSFYLSPSIQFFFSKFQNSQKSLKKIGLMLKHELGKPESKFCLFLFVST